MAGERPAHHALWLWIGAASVAVACAFLVLTPGASAAHPHLDRWTSGEAIVAYCLGFIAVACFAMAALGQPFPPRLSAFREAQPEVTTSVIGDAPQPDTTARMRPLLAHVRSELVLTRGELGSAMRSGSYKGLLNIFWAGTDSARDEIAALDSAGEVYPAIAEAYDEIQRFCGQIDSTRFGGGPILESDAIERTAVSVYAAIARIDAWEASN